MLSQLHRRIWVLDILKEITGRKEQGHEVDGIVFAASSDMRR